MKLLIIGNKERYEKFRPDLPIYDESEKIFCPRGTSDQDLLKDGRDADVILADAITPVSAQLIGQMPNLKMIPLRGRGPLTRLTRQPQRPGESTCATTRGEMPALWPSRPFS